MPTIIDLRPEIEKVSGRIAIVALLILCLCIKVYTTQFWHDMNVDHRVKCKVIDRIVEDETITQDGQMAELVDASDLKSGGQKCSCGFDSRSGYN